MPDPARTQHSHSGQAVPGADPTRPAAPPQVEARIAELENEVDELRSANVILLSVATYFSNGQVPPDSVAIPVPPAES
ncbi:hypothetical protein AB0C11_13660 [Streptomyces sp. NPDC039016]|uniref:hypothetical protein n=1 Tax=Streptomyces sp. NPDC039016 TaxID=3154330 RepID=UPI0033D5FE54